MAAKRKSASTVGHPKTRQSRKALGVAEPIRVCAYIRVSTARDDMVSPELQQTAIEKFVATQTTDGRPWVIVHTEEDLDMSGRTFARDGVKAAINGALTKQWDRIVVYNYSRFGRNSTQAALHIGQVEQAGAQVISATEGSDVATAFGRFSRGMLLQIAELYSDQMSDSWKASQARRVAQGLPSGGQPRWGYRYHNPKVGKKCQQGCAEGTCTVGYTPDPVLGPALRECYLKYNAGDGFQAVTEWLVSQGFPTTRGGQWATSQVQRMMLNGFAAGWIVHNGEWSIGAHPPVITPEEWETFIEVHRGRRPMPNKTRSPKWALASIAVCALCGSNLVATYNKGHEQWKSRRLLRCSRHQAQGSASCRGVYITEEDVLDAAFVVIRRWAPLLDEELGKSVQFEDEFRKSRSDRKSQQSRLESTIRTERTRQRKWAALAADGKMPDDLFADMVSKSESAIAAAQRQLATLKAQETPSVIRQPVTEGVLTLWSELPASVQRAVYEKFIERVIVYPSRNAEKQKVEGPRINIVWKSYVSFPANPSWAGPMPLSESELARLNRKPPRRTRRSVPF